MSLESFDAQLVTTMEDIAGQPMEDLPFRVALLGDWSGRSNRGLFASDAELADWRPLLVDRDNIDQVMTRLGVELRLPHTGASKSTLTLQFNELEDFHPDKIFDRSELFQSLRDIKARLTNPKTFPEAAEEVTAWMESSALDNLPQQADQPQRPAGEKTDLSGGDLLDRVLEMSDGGGGPRSGTTDKLLPDIRSLVQEVVRPFRLPDDFQQESLLAAVDRAAGRQMLAIIHHPAFQALEAAWRALDYLVSRLETGTQLKLYLLDISLEELRASLVQHNKVQSTGIYRLLVEKTVETFGGEPWAILAGNYFFGLTEKDAELLKKLSIVGHAAKAPVVAGAQSSVVGCESLGLTPDPDDWQHTPDADTEVAWTELRSAPTAPYIGLAMPRFLLRLPYGSDTEPTEKISFEEMEEGAEPDHNRYLWANPAFAIVCLMGQAYLQSGWGLRPGEVQEIEGLPIHVYRINGETQIKPCAEILMTVRAAQDIAERGPMPVITMKETGTVRVGSFQSLALSGERLTGRWPK